MSFFDKIQAQTTKAQKAAEARVNADQRIHEREKNPDWAKKGGGPVVSLDAAYAGSMVAEDVPHDSVTFAEITGNERASREPLSDAQKGGIEALAALNARADLRRIAKQAS